MLIIKKAELLAIVSSSCVLASKKGKESLILSGNETAQRNTVSPKLLFLSLLMLTEFTGLKHLSL